MCHAQNPRRDPGPERDPGQASDQPTAGRNHHPHPRPIKPIQSPGQFQASSQLNNRGRGCVLLHFCLRRFVEGSPRLCFLAAGWCEDQNTRRRVLCDALGCSRRRLQPTEVLQEVFRDLRLAARRPASGVRSPSPAVVVFQAAGTWRAWALELVVAPTSTLEAYWRVPACASRTRMAGGRSRRASGPGARDRCLTFLGRWRESGSGSKVVVTDWVQSPWFGHLSPVWVRMAMRGARRLEGGFGRRRMFVRKLR
ncbi:hypothetical protein MTO96_050471 [Rhipicephalus appendiculatus]